MRALEEGNPMLGTRGVRLGLIHPEIYEMQARAIFRAARGACASAPASAPRLEIMIPLVAYARELEHGARPGRCASPPRRASRPARLQRRHDDRAAARVLRAPARSHATPSSSRSAPTTSRRPRSASRATTSRAGSSPATWTTGSSSARRSGRSTRTASASSCAWRVERGRAARPELEVGHLRRARRRPGLDPLLPRRRARLRQLLAVPRADRARRRRAGGARSLY